MRRACKVPCEYADINGGLDLDKYCETRFGTAVIMCESLKKNIDPVRKTAVSSAFQKWMSDKKNQRRMRRR